MGRPGEGLKSNSGQRLSNVRPNGSPSQRLGCSSPSTVYVANGTLSSVPLVVLTSGLQRVAVERDDAENHRDHGHGQAEVGEGREDTLDLLLVCGGDEGGDAEDASRAYRGLLLGCVVRWGRMSKVVVC